MIHYGLVIRISIRNPLRFLVAILPICRIASILLYPYDYRMVPPPPFPMHGTWSDQQFKENCKAYHHTHRGASESSRSGRARFTTISLERRREGHAHGQRWKGGPRKERRLGMRKWPKRGPYLQEHHEHQWDQLGRRDHFHPGQGKKRDKISARESRKATQYSVIQKGKGMQI